MGTAIRFGVVGAGSAVVSLGLVKDLCLTPGLARSEVAFMDVNAERLETVAVLARPYAAEVGADLRFTATLAREAALRESDVVVNTAFARGHYHEARGRELGAPARLLLRRPRPARRPVRRLPTDALGRARHGAPLPRRLADPERQPGLRGLHPEAGYVG